jgi:RND family efflux transporter MFP subunit
MKMWRMAQYILMVCAVGGALGGALGCSHGVAATEEKVPPAPVKWEGARQIFLEEWTELVGTTVPLPDHAARVTAAVEGRVLSVLTGTNGKQLVEGQSVQKSDVLVQLDATTQLANRAKAEAAKKVMLAEKEATDLAVRQAALEFKAKDDLKRRQEKEGSNLVSSVDWEKAQLALEAANARARADEQKLRGADDELKALDQLIGLYTLTAPRSGRLGRLQVVVGQTLSLGTAVADIVDIENEIDVLCFVAAVDARKLAVGQPARVGAIGSAATGVDPVGSVAFIADQAEAETGLLAVKVRFPNRDLKLRANAVVRLRVLTQPGRACWAVPEVALTEDQDPPTVVAVEDIATKTNADGKEEQAGKARRLRAVIGVRDRVLKQVEVLRLEDPDKKWQGDLEHVLIVVEKGQGLQTGDAVRLEQEEDEEPPK